MVTQKSLFKVLFTVCRLNCTKNKKFCIKIGSEIIAIIHAIMVRMWTEHLIGTKNFYMQYTMNAVMKYIYSTTMNLLCEYI